jgi:hypothetical protein
MLSAYYTIACTFAHNAFAMQQCTAALPGNLARELSLKILQVK